jgi:hypothetical protein
MNVRRAARKRSVDVIEKPPGLSERESTTVKTPRCTMLAKNTARLRLRLSAEDKSSVIPKTKTGRSHPPRTSQTMPTPMAIAASPAIRNAFSGIDSTSPASFRANPGKPP